MIIIHDNREWRVISSGRVNPDTGKTAVRLSLVADPKKCINAWVKL